MENLFFKRDISRVYDLKGSTRARYNSDTTGTNKVLLDMNLLETLRTKPIFLGSKAKRSLERAVWNDTSFLAVIFFFNLLIVIIASNLILTEIRTKVNGLVCLIIVDIVHIDIP